MVENGVDFNVWKGRLDPVQGDAPAYGDDHSHSWAASSTGRPSIC
jgi:hypothetical protein